MRKELKCYHSPGNGLFLIPTTAGKEGKAERKRKNDYFLIFLKKVFMINKIKLNNAINIKITSVK